VHGRCAWSAGSDRQIQVPQTRKTCWSHKCLDVRIAVMDCLSIRRECRPVSVCIITIQSGLRSRATSRLIYCRQMMMSGNDFLKSPVLIRWRKVESDGRCCYVSSPAECTLPVRPFVSPQTVFCSISTKFGRSVIDRGRWVVHDGMPYMTSRPDPTSTYRMSESCQNGRF